MKKTVLFFLIFCMVLTLGFARGGQADSSGRIELNFMEVMTSPTRTEVIREIIAEYESLHPNVRINLISPPYEQADGRLVMSLEAGEPLDIVEVRDIRASQHVLNNQLEDLTPYVNRWAGWNTILPTGKDLAAAAGGKPYMIPQFFYIPALFIRTDVLSRLGITKAPETLDELFANCKQITDPARSQYGFTLRGRGNPFRQSDLLTISDLKDVDLASFYKMKNGSGVFDNPEYLASFSRFADMVKNAVPSDGINWGFNEQITSFASGITPYLMQDPDAVPVVDEHLRRDQYTVVPMPVGRSGVFYYEPGFASLGIPSYSKNKEAAWDFITFISSPDNNAKICKAYGALPVHSTTFTSDSYFSSGVYQAWATVLNSPQKYVTVRYPYTSEKYPGWAQIYEQFFQSALLGQTTPAQAVKAWADYWK